MNIEPSPEHEEFRRDIRNFINREVTDELRDEMRTPEGWIATGRGTLGFLQKMGESGWLGVSWPVEHGGRGLPLIYQHILIEEFTYNGLPYGGHTVNTLGPILARIGTDEQRQAYLPPILRGQSQISLGYTEPDAGSDLASMKTAAVRDGDEYIINGEKIYCTGVQVTDYIWLATRTDPQAPKHKGMSIFMVPSKSPGISHRPLLTMAGERTNQVWLEDVRVPASALIGEENQGWYVAALALDFQRVTVSARTAAFIQRVLDMTIQYARETNVNGQPLGKDPVVRHQLAELFVATQVARLFAHRNTWMVDNGMPVDKEAAIAKAWSTELNQRVLSVAMQILGPSGQLQPGSHRAPMDGYLEAQYRAAPMVKFGGGTNEIQLNIIAERGLGLPR